MQKKNPNGHGRSSDLRTFRSLAENNTLLEKEGEAYYGYLKWCRTGDETRGQSYHCTPVYVVRDRQYRRP